MQPVGFKRLTMTLKTFHLAAQQSYCHFTYNIYDGGAQSFA